MKYALHLWLSVLLLVPFAPLQAQSETSAVPEACFESLKRQALDSQPHFQFLLKTLRTGRYTDINEKLLGPYSGAVSFGLELNKPVIETRVYSWGAQTGYKMPQGSPFPAYRQSEILDQNLKKGAFVEEYVVAPSGDSEFIGCGFLFTENDGAKFDRSEVLEVKPLRSFRGTYNAGAWWYGDYALHGYDSQFLATQRALFLYPEATQNDYFDRYSVLDSFPGEPSEALVQESTLESLLLEGEPLETQFETQKQDKLFPYVSYYEALETQFPDFATHLSIKGALDYSNFKIFATKPGKSNWSIVKETVLSPLEVMAYVRERGQNPDEALNNDYEQVLADPDFLNGLFDPALLEAEEARVKQQVERVAQEEVEADFEQQSYLWLAGIIGCLVLAALGWYFYKRRS